MKTIRMKVHSMLLWRVLAALTFGFALGCSVSSDSLDSNSPPFNSDSTARPPVRTFLPQTDGFDFPVGPPDAKKYYNAQGFGENLHLGDDWNGVGGGNTDFGDPVFAIAAGKVKFAQDNGAGWGNVMLIQHNIASDSQPQFVESLYAHLDTMIVPAGSIVRRGQQIGTIGDAHGAYAAHLHFEIRSDTLLPVGGGYSEDVSGFLDPTLFIQTHRPLKK
jgi:murein DD-endopeptidase MepM/ murein hydrolase activator NlpD